jgi:uncharacterized damage-inducible protein DinB
MEASIVTKQIAKHFREVYFGGNWTTCNFKSELADVTRQQATTPVYSFNTIATLVHHTSYYIHAVWGVLQGQPLTAKDNLSFAHPPINSAEDWNDLLNKTWIAVDTFACQVELLPEGKLWEVFVEEKYGNYYRNLHGIIEHSHYHLGQIVLIKKILASAAATSSDLVLSF